MKSCHTKEVSLEEKKEIINDVERFEAKISNEELKLIPDEDTIKIKIVYHICYKDSLSNVIRDTDRATNVLNEDFNMKASNFDNGKEIYKNKKEVSVKYLPYHKIIPEIRYKRLTRITWRMRRNRRLFYRVLRDNRRKQYYNTLASRKNVWIRKVNYKRRQLNRKIKRINDKRKKDFQNNNNQNKLYEIYTNYVSRAGSCNIHFETSKRILGKKIVGDINFDELSNIDSLVKINTSPIQQGDENKLNIWIVDFNSGLLGYAQFPWELKKSPKTDGIVLDINTFKKEVLHSSYNLGKTLTHEVGHWLGLYHVFQRTYSGQVGQIDTDNDGLLEYGERTGDLVTDTPIQMNPSYGNSYEKQWPVTIINGKKYYSMFMNFMDYSNDINLFMLTKEQCKKVRLFINIYRKNFNYNI